MEQLKLCARPKSRCIARFDCRSQHTQYFKEVCELRPSTGASRDYALSKVRRLPPWIVSWLLVVLFPSVVASQAPPVTAGLIAHYNADSWTGSMWTDLSGAGNHVTDFGGSTISVARPVGAPAFIYGATTAWMKFPAQILPSADYTLFYVARYNGAARGRIFQGINTYWLSGFHDGNAGVAIHGCEITPKIDWHGCNWVMGTDRSNSFRSNGVERKPITSTGTACVPFDRLAINRGGANSDFAVQSVLVYNRRLPDDEVLRVEAWLTSLQPDFTPANLQASAYYF